MTQTLFWERAADTPLVTVSVLARGGAGVDESGSEGLAHHIAELAVRGAGDLDRLGIDTEFDRVGTSLAVNTARDYFGYTATCLARHCDRVVEILADVITNPRFSDDEHAKLIRETTSDLEEIRDDDADLAARFFARHFWPGHPYARAIEGSETSLEMIGAQAASALRERFRALTGGDNLITGFAGCIDEADVARYDAKLRASAGERTPIAEPPTGDGERQPRVVLVDKPDRLQSQVLIGHPAPHYASTDGPALLVAEAAFGGMFSSRMMQEVRVKRGLSYDAGIHLARAALPSWIRMSMAPNAAQVEGAIALVLDLYRDLARQGISQSELDLARRFTIGSMLLSRATARQRVQQSCIGAIANLAPDFTETLPDVLRALTLEQVNRSIAEHLRPTPDTIVVVGAASLADKLSRFGQVEVIDYRAY